MNRLQGLLITSGQAVIIGVFAFFLFGPLVNLGLWAFTEKWYFPHKLPLEYGLKYWEYVFRPQGDAFQSLTSSVWIALLTVIVCLLVSVPSGFALSRRSLPFRSLLLLIFLMPQAFPTVAVYANVAKIFYQFGLNGTVAGVVLVHAVHGLVYSVWICSAAFASVDQELEEAARNVGSGPVRTFFTINLPLALPGVVASSIFVFLESLDEFTGTFFVGAPEVSTMPILLYLSGMEGNYQIASITTLILLVPSITFMLFIERFLKAGVISKIGA